MKEQRSLAPYLYKYTTMLLANYMYTDLKQHPFLHTSIHPEYYQDYIGSEEQQNKHVYTGSLGLWNTRERETHLEPFNSIILEK